MKTRVHCATFALAFTILTLIQATTFAQSMMGTAFTYQGRLNQDGIPANGRYDLTFTLYNAATHGAQLLWPCTNIAVAVDNGVFTTTVDFYNSTVFDGNARWLELGVQTNGGAGFTALLPRQAVTPTPYAIKAGSAMVAGPNSVSTASIMPNAIGTGKIANGVVVRSLNGLTDTLTMSAGANMTITPSGNGLIFSAAGSGGSGVWSVLNNNASYSAGNVGIGTTTPSLYGHGGTGRILEINNSGTAMHSQAHLMLYTGVNSFKDSAMGSVTWAQPGGMAAYIGAQTRSATPNFPSATLTFGTRKAGEAGASPRMVITDEGNVGLGTTDPGGRLHVVGDWDGEQGALQLSGLKPTLRFTGGFTQNHQSWIVHLGAHGPGNLEFMNRTGPGAYASVLALDPYEGNVGIGTSEPLAKLDVRGTTRTCVLTITGGCDLAEPFPIVEQKIEKGAVMVIDEEHPGHLRLSTLAYDARVAGVISGANGLETGIALQQAGMFDQGHNVALSGRVYVQADATYGAIKPGDLLTTSVTPGHAMKAIDHARAQGAILGKAMSRLEAGQGMVLVLVTLQ